MRFLRKDKFKKTILVLSDLHLGAGATIARRRNNLEDFYYDKELVEFLEYYSTGDFQNREIELVINGDLFDLLAVPFVKFFDDEFWSEKASLEKLKIIIDAHKEVMEALVKFVSGKKRSIVYILGNHDAELIFKSLQSYLLELFPEEDRDKVTILEDFSGEYSPIDGVVFKHGHELDIANHYHPKKAIIKDSNGVNYFLPPWGSYFVTRVINKFKEERNYVHCVRPLRKFIINGLIYDTLFTFRFIIACTYYFLMVRFIYFFKQNISLRKMISYISDELALLRDRETLTEDFFNYRKGVRVLVQGHTHEPFFKTFEDGSIFINTGSWTKMYNLDFGKETEKISLTYAQINIREDESETTDILDNLDIGLNVWRGRNELPFYEFQ